MAKKMWGGRFAKKTNPLVEEFTKSIGYDYKLALWDIIGSLIHVDVLNASGFINNSEKAGLKAALSKIYNSIEKGSFRFDKESEDIHSNIQNALEKHAGKLALKLHTARSRNDQVLFDLKMFTKAELVKLESLAQGLIGALMDQAKRTKGIIIPGFTHLQHAQLVYLSDYFLCYAEMIKKDAERMAFIYRNISLSMGSGALAGTPIKPGLYDKALRKFIAGNKKIASQLGADITLSKPKALYTVSDRDFVIEALSAIALMGMHASRIAEELIIWSTKEFDFLELDDAFTTGSSLMPQKKNPDALELIRGYTGTLYGNLISALTMMKGLTLSYNRDMQLDKPPLFSSIEIGTCELRILTGLVGTLKWNKKAINEAVEKDETIYATDLVYYLVKKGASFRDAHDVIGRLVKYSCDNGIKVGRMSDMELSRFSKLLKRRELASIMTPMASVNSRISVRG